MSIDISGQIIATSAEVTPNGGLVRESPQNPLNSGLGIIVICPDRCDVLVSTAQLNVMLDMLDRLAVEQFHMVGASGRDLIANLVGPKRQNHRGPKNDGRHIRQLRTSNHDLRKKQKGWERIWRWAGGYTPETNMTIEK